MRSPSATGPAKALGAMFVLGAILMAFVASGLVFDWPVKVSGGAGLYAVLGAWLVIYLPIAVTAAADAGRLGRRGDVAALQESANTVKLCAVPFFIFNFFTLTVIVLAAIYHDSDRFGFAGFALALLFVVLTYLVMLPSSAYGVVCLRLLRKGDQVGPVFFGVNMLLQSLFVSDVISTILVVEVTRDRLAIARPPSTVQRHLMTAVLAVGSAVATVWLVFVAGYYLLDWYGVLVSDAIHQLTFSSQLEFVLLVMVPVIPLMTFRAAVRMFLHDDLDALRRCARAVKLSMIPLFVQNFLLCVFVLTLVSFYPVVLAGPEALDGHLSAIALLGFIAAAGFAPAIIGTWLMLLPTSIHSITCLALMMRHRLITPRFCAVHMILQFVFVADIISTLVVARRARQALRLPERQFARV
jgi:hypothetical protein